MALHYAKQLLEAKTLLTAKGHVAFLQQNSFLK